MNRAILLPSVLLAACEWGGGPGAFARLPPDAPKVTVDASSHKDGSTSVDAAVDAAAGPPRDAPVPVTTHLLLSELALSPDGAEFIEVYNPTADAIDLTNYFVANSGIYYTLPLAAPSLPSGHFIVNFPVGNSIPPDTAYVIAMGTEDDFFTAYGIFPDYSIEDGTILTVAGSTVAHLTDGGSAVELFYWDGMSGLVQDVDIMIAGVPGAASALINKSGVTQMGKTYATDAMTIAPQAMVPGSGLSTKRIAAELGHEAQNGIGNGLTGHDETSEHTQTTWDTTFSTPTPDDVPAF